MFEFFFVCLVFLLSFFCLCCVFALLRFGWKFQRESEAFLGFEAIFQMDDEQKSQKHNW